MLRAASVGQPRSVNDANVENMLDGLTTLTSTNTYYCIVVACKFVKAGGVGPTLVVRTTLFVGGVEVVMTSIVAVKDIGNDFQE